MASKKKTDQTVRMATLDQLKQLVAIIVQAIPTRITFAQAQHWIGHARELTAKIRELLAVADPYREQVEAWRKFYADVFGLTVDLSALRVTEPRPGFGRLIVVVPGITIEMVLKIMAKSFKVWRWTNDNLDELMAKGGRSAANGPYAIWVRERIEADEEHANKSYNDLQKANIIGITFLEYALLHLKHFLEHGFHLDDKNITLCSGLLFRGGNVPSAYWHSDDGEFCVDWYDRDYALPFLRCREAVVGQP